MANVGNPPLRSGVIAVPSGPKSHTFTVILAVIASQPRCRHKPWKSLFHVYSPHLWSRKLFKCTQLIAVLSGPFVYYLICHQSYHVNLLLREWTHTITGRPCQPPRGKNLEILVLKLGKVLRTLKKVVRFAKFPSGWPTAHDNFATV